MPRTRLGWLNIGSLSVAGHRIAGGLEVFREHPNATPYVVCSATFDGWRAEMRLALQRGRLVVASLSVTPAAEEIPAGGLVSRLLRQIPVHAHVRAIAERMQRPYQRQTLEVLFAETEVEGALDAMLAGPRAPASPRRGRRPVAEETLLQVAAAYSEATKAGSPRPVEEAAARLAMTMPRARDYVHRARGRGFLTPAEWGRSGGQLTPKAHALLRPRRPKTSPRSRQRARRMSKTPSAAVIQLTRRPQGVQRTPIRRRTR
jgi:hypothetical protein